MKSPKTLSVQQQFKEAISYLKESKTQILIITIIFITSILIGFFNADKLTIIDTLIKQIINKTINLNATELIFFILQNNLQASFFGLVSGIFFGIFPIITTLIVIGYVIERVSQVASLSDILKAFIPHGIFELPAVLISLGLGLKFSGFIFAKPGKIINELKRRFFNSINVFLFIILPLLIIAAIIEGLAISFL